MHSMAAETLDRCVPGKVEKICGGPCPATGGLGALYLTAGEVQIRVEGQAPPSRMAGGCSQGPGRLQGCGGAPEVTIPELLQGLGG